VPVVAYCKFNVEHFFKSVKERDTHEEICENRTQYERNNEKTQKIYNKNRNWIEQQRVNKKAKDR